MADSYESLLCVLRVLLAAVEVSLPDIEQNSGGRLCKHRAAAILDGGCAATAEEFVLLLRGCRLREEVQLWVEAWLRLDGPTLGVPRRTVASWWPRLPTLRILSAISLLGFLALIVLLVNTLTALP